nr:MAG TPA: hypothetical protein [Caudoviricetes sp.]
MGRWHEKCRRKVNNNSLYNKIKHYKTLHVTYRAFNTDVFNWQ